MKRVTMNYVHGSVACKPDCSRYRNENERIIAFPQKSVNRARTEDTTGYAAFTSVAHAHNQMQSSKSDDLALLLEDLSYFKHIIDDVRACTFDRLKGVSGNAHESHLYKVGAVMGSVILCTSLVLLVL